MDYDKYIRKKRRKIEHIYMYYSICIRMFWSQYEDIKYKIGIYNIHTFFLPNFVKKKHTHNKK